VGGEKGSTLFKTEKRKKGAMWHTEPYETRHRTHKKIGRKVRTDWRRTQKGGEKKPVVPADGERMEGVTKGKRKRRKIYEIVGWGVARKGGAKG